MTAGLKQTEKQFMQAVVEAAKALGWRHYHEGHSFGSKPGKPDLELTHPEHGILFLELKVGSNQPTDAQRDWIVWYRHCDIPAHVVWPEDWDAIEAMLHGNRVELIGDLA